MGAAGLLAPYFIQAISSSLNIRTFTLQGWAQQFRHSDDIKSFGSKMTLHGTHKAFSFRCFAANGRGFGADSTNKRKIKSKRRPKDVAVEPRSALEKKKAEENKDYQAIDYDAPIESDKIVVFGLVFAFGDFLPYGSVSPSKESAVVKQKLSQEEEAKFKSELQGFEATLSKSPNDPTALEMNVIPMTY
ncbi:uncharacterized protein C2845_PM03G25170 [Panicum miliaceum]|uniref:Uncharacterized protein n=1 Tax=Panicum miliaceum TaxID=4540 RepID=A0A3L6T533_PANMI|nr:uncharacterized protein C2845_PM03G25170 [Panicum miliaceum]